MPSGILVVQSQPSSPEEAAEYHRWYVDVHLPEILKVDGVVSARRLEAIDGGSFLAVYEIDGDVAQAKEAMANAQRSGSMSRPVGLQLDPRPTIQWFRDMGESSGKWTREPRSSSKASDSRRPTILRAGRAVG